MQVIEIAAKETKHNRRLKVAAYARVSTATEASLRSITNQQEYYRDFIAKNPKWELVDIYVDNGISGTIVERPEFQRLLADCCKMINGNRMIDLVITKSITRFARNIITLLSTIRGLKQLGIDVYFEKEQMHSLSNDGEMMLTILAMYAEEEARSASENQRWRIRKRFEQGQPWVGRMLGYKLGGRDAGDG